jgi:hypothetical protein
MTVQLTLPKDVERELVADVRSGRHATLQEAILERISRSRGLHRLAVGRKSESKSFAQIMEPVRKAAGAVDEDEIVRLVDRARGPRRQRPRRKKGEKS